MPRGDQVLTTRVGLLIPDLLTFDDWQQAGRRLAGVVDSSSWWLGDWMAYGKEHYSDRYQQGIRTAGLQYQTLRNYAWVARRFDMDRRRARLTFQHHAEVASLPPDEQDQWLDRAEASSWTTKQLRGALREAKPTGGTPAATPVHRLPVPGDHFERWHQAAERSGIEVEEWVLTTLDSAAESVLAAAAEAAALTQEQQPAIEQADPPAQP
ncbi:LmbU family transcriptional regulator [Streptomyces coryli]|uniref:LmbU family transcriptional regulator n=1 Tax=Streptomyces coryli TaxID=1128680 RepID=UPI0019CFBECA|nr:LmbU family transcriptional regulator [Streptomyces coryli]